MYLIVVFVLFNYYHIKVFPLLMKLVLIDRVYYSEHFDRSFAFFGIVELLL